jgi:hypothetical protein
MSPDASFFLSENSQAAPQVADRYGRQKVKGASPKARPTDELDAHPANCTVVFTINPKYYSINVPFLKSRMTFSFLSRVGSFGDMSVSSVRNGIQAATALACIVARS